MTFVVAILVVFDPVLNTSALLQNQNNSEILVLLGLLILAPIIILSYLLIALNSYLINFYSGYSFLHNLPLISKLQLRKAKKLWHKIKSARSEILKLEKRRRKSPKEKELLEKLKNEYYSNASYYNLNFPPVEAGIMPTQLGNILRASEAYAGTHYGLDAVAFWPLLMAVIPEKYQEKIDSARNELSFLLNLSFLSTVFLIVAGSASIFIRLNPLLANISTFPALALEYRFLLAMAISFILILFFNRVSLYSALSYGSVIRSAFDLYRLDLLEKFRIKLPKNSVEEFYIWKNIGELIVLGQESLDFMPLQYTVRSSKK